MMNTEKIPIIAIVGPTASGKTAASLYIAGYFGGEIVSADSMQIYKELSVGTAKPSLEEREKAKHYLVDFLSIEENYSVADYTKDAKQAIEEIHAKGKIPVVCGGTGLYVDSLLNNIEFDSFDGNEEIREELKKEAETAEGKEKLFKELCEVDPKAAEKIHPNNVGRVIRALEIFRQTGIPISEHQRVSKLSEKPYNVCKIGLSYRKRETLYGKIEKRVDYMLKNGLEKEASFLFEHDENCTAAQAIGYKEFYPYFKGECCFYEAVENLKKETRHYAKRQLTWFRKDEETNWVFLDDYPDFEDACAAMSQLVEKSGILAEEK